VGLSWALHPTVRPEIINAQIADLISATRYPLRWHPAEPTRPARSHAAQSALGGGRRRTAGRRPIHVVVVWAVACGLPARRR
jgi:hypothetical protein